MDINFGTDGLRGRAFVDLRPEHAYKIGAALASAKPGKILLGFDTRESSIPLAAAFASGALSYGANVEWLGVVPTPLVAFLSSQEEYMYGVMITASHNPYYDNGIKIFGAGGIKISEREKAYLQKKLKKAGMPGGKAAGKIIGGTWSRERYVKRLSKLCPQRLDGLRVVLDCANGALSFLAKRVFQERGATVYCLNNIPDGRNINLHAGSLCVSETVVRPELKSISYDIGFSYDGDGDRVISFLPGGSILDGDLELRLLARRLKDLGVIDNPHIAVTVMSDRALVRKLASDGFIVSRTGVGDHRVYCSLKDSGGQIGAEKAGHIIIVPFGSSGDGLLSSLLLASFLKEQPDDFQRIVATSPSSYRRERSIKTGLAKRIAASLTLRDLEELGTRHGIRTVIRASGTEPLLRIMAEGDDPDKVDRHIAAVIKAARKEITSNVRNSRSVAKR